MAHEMSMDLKSKRSSSNLVAKLMGLDALPQPQVANLSSGRSQLKCHKRGSYSEVPVEYCDHEHSYCCDEMNYGSHLCQERCNTKDTYEIWEQTQIKKWPGDGSPQKGRCKSDNDNERKIALIRQKFMEAKRLSTDRKLCQTKEFQDALEVLSSNKNLYFKALPKPNSLISGYQYGGQMSPPSTGTKRITILKPSKMMFNEKYPASRIKRDENVKKEAHRNKVNIFENETCGVFPSVPTWEAEENAPNQPTRIMVLKPGRGKLQNVMEVAGSTPLLPRYLQQMGIFEVPEDETHEQEVREAAKEITQHVRKNLAGHRREETSLSSIFSNCYTGDESSIYQSEAELVENFSDSEVMSSPSRISWEYISEVGSPYSGSSLSQASYYPESSVSKEAKKRLSERWARVASRGEYREQNNVWRSSSTLGEMLSLSDTKISARYDLEHHNKDEEPRASTSCLASNSGDYEAQSPRSLARSNSLPISATAFSERASRSGKTTVIKEASKPTSKSSIKSKVTSLLFSQGKKCSKEKLDFQDASQLTHSEILPSSVPAQSGPNKPLKYHGSGEILPAYLQSANGNGFPNSEYSKASMQAELCVSRPATIGICTENLDQPSPISVLEPSFERNGFASCCSSTNYLDNQMLLCPGKSNLIDKSPPIGSISRILSWSEPCAESASCNPLTSSFLSSRGGSEDDEEWLFLVQTLLSLADLESESHLVSNLARWHSLSSPLNPLLCEKFIELEPKELYREAKRRCLRSKRKLVFDCVNVALVDIAGFGSNLGYQHITAHAVPHESKPVLGDRVWGLVKEWRSGGETKGFSLEDSRGDGYSLVVKRVVGKELGGKEWADLISHEINDIGKEIEGELLQELVVESLWT